MFLFVGLAILFLHNLSLTANVVNVNIHGFGFADFIGILFLSFALVFLVVGKGIESVVMVPTGPMFADRERTAVAVRDYQDRKSNNPEYVLISGEVNNRDERGRATSRSQPIGIYKQLRKSGVPREEIMFEPDSADTLQNFIYTLGKMKKKGLHDLRIATDKWQYKRFQYYLDRARTEGLVGGDFKMSLVESNPVRPSLGYAIMSYYQDKGRIEQAGSLDTAAKYGKVSGTGKRLYLMARGFLGI